MQCQIAPMAIEDYDEALALWANTDGVGLNESDQRDQIDAFLKRNPGLSLVARNNGKLVAAVLCGYDGRRGYLHHLAVALEHRGRGLGRQMVQICLDKLLALGIPRCNIFLLAGNDPAEAFWRRLGWKDRAELKVMQRPIGPAL